MTSSLCSLVFANVARGADVGGDLLVACNTARGHKGGVGVGKHTLRAWERAGLVKIVRVPEPVGDCPRRLQQSVIAVLLTEHGARERDRKLAKGGA